MEVENGPILEETGLVGTHALHFHDYGRKSNMVHLKITLKLKRKIIWTIHLHDFGFKMFIFEGCIPFHLRSQ